MGVPSPPQDMLNKFGAQNKRPTEVASPSLRLLVSLSLCSLPSPRYFPFDCDWDYVCLAGRPHESRNRCFRLLGSSKFGKSAALKVAGTNQRTLEHLVWRGKGGVISRASSPQPRDVARTLLVSEGLVADEVIASSIRVLARLDSLTTMDSNALSVFPGGHCIVFCRLPDETPTLSAT